MLAWPDNIQPTDTKSSSLCQTFKNNKKTVCGIILK